MACLRESSIAWWDEQNGWNLANRNDETWYINTAACITYIGDNAFKDSLAKHLPNKLKESQVLQAERSK